MARILHFAAYLGLLLSEGIARLLPLEWLFTLGELGGGIAYRVLRYRRRLALRNLRLAFGSEKSEDELRALNRRHFQLLGANLLAGIKAATLPRGKMWERITTENLPTERPPGWIALLSHTGNWEVYSHLVDRLPEYRFATVYQPLRNRWADRHLRASRATSGIRLFDRRTELLSCVRFLRAGGGVVGILADQGAGYAGVWTPLFGRLTSSSTLAAILSARTGLPLAPLTIATCGRGRWRLSFLDPIFPGADGIEAMTAQINRRLEEKIRRSPADWLWAHNRWKALRPHFLFAREQRRVFIPPEVDPATLDRFRILVVSPHSAEEAAASVEAVGAIKTGRPDTHVTVLTPNSLGKMWEDNRAVDAVLMFSSAENVCSLAKKIRRSGPFDAAIALVDDWRTAAAVWLARVPIRVGQKCGANRWLCNQHPPVSSGSSDCRRVYLDIAWSVGADVSAPLV